MPRYFTLLTTLYNEKDPARRAEYLSCIDRNKHNPSIDSIIIFYEKQDDNDELLEELENRGVCIHITDKQPTFCDFFDYSNTHLVGRDIVLCNADIYFDPDRGLSQLNDIDLNGLFFALTRYNKLSHINKLIDEYPNQQGLMIETREGKLRSQHLNGSSIDTWIFRSPINIDFKCDYTLGVLSCDSNLNYQVKRSRHLRVYNPCLDLISIHEHNNWTPGKYQSVRDAQGNLHSRKQWQIHNFRNGNYPAGIPFCLLADTCTPIQAKEGEYPETLKQAVSHSDRAKHVYFREDLLNDSYFYLASYPRSGSHFVRFIILSAIQYLTDKTLPHDFTNLARVPDIHNFDFLRVKPLTPTVVKTHFEYDPRYKKVIHLIRDPRDVLISYYYYIMKSNNWYMHFYNAISGPPSLPEFASLFLEGNIWPGDLKNHTRSYTLRERETEYMQIRYESLVDNPLPEITRLLEFLEIHLDTDARNKIAAHTSFQNMERLFTVESAQTGTGFSDKSQILRKGRSGGFRNEVTPEAIAWLNEAFNDYLSEYYPDSLV